MRTVIDVITLSSIAFVGTMVDNFFAYSAQLLVTDRSRYRRVGIAQAIGVAALFFVAAAVGSVLTAVPAQWTGLFCLAPWSLAWRDWRHRDRDKRPQYRRGALTTLLITIALGGDNLGVWIPLLRTESVAREVLTALVFAGWELLFLASARALTNHPRVVAWGAAHSRAITPWIYAALEFLILVESGLL